MERILLSRPRNGLVHEMSAQAAYCNDLSGRFSVQAKAESRSLLTFNFNYAWSKFISEPEWDLFVMQHADVAPLGGDWLHRLRDAMGDRFDVMHAPCLIKNYEMLTSTALGKRHFQYGPLRRLHLSELRKMPQPFSFDDAVSVLGRNGPQGHEWDCLMPNTGCLMIRRNERTIRFPGFRQCDKLIGLESGFEVRKGRPVTKEPITPATESEDWNFGRWCARNSVSVGGTINVVTRHYGEVAFTTDHACADGRDEQAFEVTASEPPQEQGDTAPRTAAS